MDVDFFNNLDKTLVDDLRVVIERGDKLAIASSCFSIYAYQKLKDQLDSIAELRFLFTSPTFTNEREKKERREFYIPRLHRERSLYNDPFEIKLRNELTQRAVARECAQWIREKVQFRSNRSNGDIPNFMTVGKYSYAPIPSFTTVTLGCERDPNSITLIQKTPTAVAFLNAFDTVWNDKQRLQDVTTEVLESIETIYRENAPEFVYYVAINNIFREFIADISEDDLPNDATGFKTSKIWRALYSFQRDAALGIINKLERYNGCVLADSVGLGKTFTALAVVNYYESRNKNVLVLCPKKLANNWNTYRGNYVGNILAEDRFRYDVLFHTDLSRVRGHSNGLDLAQLRWDNYDLIVIDESHNFRNGPSSYGDGPDKRENRYQNLLKRAIKPGVKTKVLMLSATPVNNRFGDLKNQLALSYEGDAARLSDKLSLGATIDEIFRKAQRAYNEWAKREPQDRTTSALLKALDFDFFELLDSVTIARSRKHIERFYADDKIGNFPERLQPVSLYPSLATNPNFVDYEEVFTELSKLNLAIYTPSHFILDSRKAKYATIFRDNEVTEHFTQENRELGIRRLMAVNLLKRMESSVASFRATIERILALLERTLDQIEEYSAQRDERDAETPSFEERDFDLDDQNDSNFTFGRKVKINVADMDYLRWSGLLEDDCKTLRNLLQRVDAITPERDAKLQKLLELVEEKIANPINPGNRKILIFTAFADTAEYLYRHVSARIKERFGLETALVTGDVEGRTTARGVRGDMNEVLACFSPISKDKQTTLPNVDAEIDALIATDCISEGQNLQDCDYVVNYDIHWNPVRIIQRFGRVDRIGSRNARIQLVNFWPNVSLDEYIELKAKVETRMKIVDLAATGDDNLLSAEERVELEYRKEQLRKLQHEVVDLEETSVGISITDLGLNEFRMDLIERMKSGEDVENAPLGLHAVVKGETPGVIFVLRNVNERVNIERRNRLHPFYLVYVRFDGEIVANCLQPKEVLDYMRSLARGKSVPSAPTGKKALSTPRTSISKGTISTRSRSCARLISEKSR